MMTYWVCRHGTTDGERIGARYFAIPPTLLSADADEKDGATGVRKIGGCTSEAENMRQACKGLVEGNDLCGPRLKGDFRD